ncbi:molybdopterin converting factor subunit 1 [Virgibacillus flavescens]|uniref:molybdopterin converting factor subunit 1 n=1 Tax=Virgibacillus flavescens TaxID=1611422 RepID=UPI003D3591ED
MIEVLFFAELQESAGKEKITVDADNITINELKAIHLRSYQLENIDQAMTAINEEYADENSVVKSGDIVAFIPPVSGG